MPSILPQRPLVSQGRWSAMVAVRTHPLISKAFESSPGLHSTPSHEGKLAVCVEESTGVIAHDLVYNSYCFRFVVLDPIDGDRHACQSTA